MAQVKKTEIAEQILSAARKEFLRVGFPQANIRQIAANANVSLANLYSYYSSKDAVFCAVVDSVKSELETLEKSFRNYQPASAAFDSLQIEIERSKSAASYIHKNRWDLHLLFNQAQGTSLENFSEQLVHGYTINCKNLISFLKKNGVLIPHNPSEAYFASVARMFVEATKEAVRSNTSLKLIEKHAEELTRYNHFGFRGVSGIKS